MLIQLNMIHAIEAYSEQRQTQDNWDDQAIFAESKKPLPTLAFQGHHRTL